MDVYELANIIADYGMKVIVLLSLLLIVLLVLTVLYCLTLHRALERCSPENRKMSPAMVWLQLIPFFSFVWQFFVVRAVAISLGNEFRKRGIHAGDRPGLAIGLIMCALQLVMNAVLTVPVINYVTIIAGFAFWIVYWIRIARYSSRLT